MLIAFITFHHHIGGFVEKGEQDSIELKIGKSKVFPEYTILKLLAILISNGQIKGIFLVIIVIVLLIIFITIQIPFFAILNFLG